VYTPDRNGNNYLMRDPGGGTGPWRSLHRRAVRAARTGYVGIERTPLAPLLRIPAVQRLKARITYMPASQVLALLGQLDAAGVHVWIAGGWGVDALAGRQNRRHYDLDLVISDHPGVYDEVANVLARAGFRHVESECNPGLPMPWRHVWQHDDGYSVEVLPVVLQDPPFSVPRSRAPAPGAPQPSFTQGSIDGRPVPCLSARLQLVLHTGYPPRDVDAFDTDVLRAHLDHAEGTLPA
jgi:lincosamide nucleotidyltransferase A/C/D/E